MREFLDAGFGHVVEPGLIEIAYSGTDGGAITRARLFDNTPAGRSEAATFAARINAETGVNCYFAPSLRKIDTQRDKRAKKVNVLGSPMVWADFDAEGAAEAAKPIYERKGLAPHRAIVTGRLPAKRAQAFWFLDALVHDQRELDELLAGVHVGLDFVADPKVVNADRVMRLPGSIAWPKPGKEGRAAELTELHTPGGAPVAPYAIDQVRAVFPPRDPVAARKGQNLAPGGDLLAHSAPVAGVAGFPATSAPAAREKPVSASPVAQEREFDMLGRRVDGRDEYAMQVIGGAIRNLTAKLGRYPTAEEIAADAWPTYERHCAPKKPLPGEPVREGLEREGRGPTWFGQKCQTHAERARTGAIAGLETVEKCQAAVAALGGVVAFAAPSDPTSLFPFWRQKDLAAIPLTDFVYSDFYARGYSSVTVAEPKIGKSLLGLCEAIDMATGRGILTGERRDPLRVVYYNAEDDQSVIDSRVAALLAHYGIAQAEIEGRLAAVSGVERDDFFFASGPEGAINEPLFAAMGGFVRLTGAAALIFDPLQDVSRSPETNDVFRLIGQRLRRFASEHHVALGLVHHTRKLQAGISATIDDARGGGALRGTARFNRVLAGMTPEQAEKAGVASHKHFFRIADLESNLAPPSADVNRWFEKVSVEVPNGARIGAVVPWQWPDAFEGITVTDAERVRRTVAADVAGFGADVRCTDWIGIRVGEELGFDASKKGAGRERARSLVSAWIASGALVERTVRDGRAGREQVRVFAGEESLSTVTTVKCG
ncbi:AAA family ATPase [Albidovulum sp.]|uniref:AAA family ATPase n=1 Tax=Albidovulum sp. TaxID=1872424 RepID=UPI0039B8C7C6